MSKLDKFLGLDDERERQERAPLWKRAVWHALKTLVRKHPGAALSATASGTGYAVKQGVEEGAEAIMEKYEGAREALTPAKAAGRHDKNKRLMGGDATLVIDYESPAGAHDAPHTAGAPESVHELSKEEKKELVESLKPEDRKALEELAKKGR